ncbi:CvpA family protein [Candidatus Gottesmanbacteria bacterium]|nr:CvpA family protein [Candidatus Gottesmanbacteria bacterium]
MIFPSLKGNWIDLLILLVFGYYFYQGLSRGFLLGLLDVGGFLLSFLSALKLYKWVGTLLVDNFSLPPGIANASGFLLVGFVAEVLFSKLISFSYERWYPKIAENIEKRKLGRTVSVANKILSIIPAMGEAVVFTAFILTLLVALPIQGGIKKDIVSSKLGGPLVAKTQGIERELNNIFGQAVNESLTFITVNPNPAVQEKVDLRFTQKEVKIDENAEETMLNLVNEERIKQGLSRLLLDAALRTLARDYARDMFARGYFSHYNPEGESPFDRMKRYNISFIAAGENLALAPNVQLSHQGLMNSPGHRANILSPEFGKVGIGVIDGGIYGEMFVQEFTN